MGKKVDPVCGMTVDDSTEISSTYKGKEYFFCREECKTQFEANPLKYTR